jgi:hypothetical protein
LRLNTDFIPSLMRMLSAAKQMSSVSLTPDIDRTQRTTSTRRPLPQELQVQPFPQKPTDLYPPSL